MDPAGAPSILLVEDSDTQALQLSIMLEREGFSVSRACSAEAALDLLNQAIPDLMIVDYRLPGMNGDELARQVRLNTDLRSLPLLMLTEEKQEAIERQGLDSGANAYVPKSSDRSLLMARLRSLLKRRGSDLPIRAGNVAALRRAEVILIEEGATFRLFLGELLAAEGYSVQSVAKPEDLPNGAAEDADCILIGLEAGRFDPFSAARDLDAGRSTGRGAFELIGIGGGDGDERARTAFAAGFDDVFPRGSDRETLAARIRAAVRRKLLRDEEMRLAAERRTRDLELARAQAEAAAADALATANRELAASNARLRDTQAQLIQAAKMASLGELVAGIAHELNNPLAFILAHRLTVERLVREEAGPAPSDRIARVIDRLGAMAGGLERIQELVTKLRTFSRFEEAGAVEMDVPGAIDNVLTLLAPKLSNRITVERRYGAPPRLVASPALVNQVVMNLISNAADAIDGQTGRVTIETDADERLYRIAVGDSGPGIPSELRDRIFEPFFTTKDVGAGTGLGLAIAYGVVRAQKGSIEIGTSRDGGALFTVAVPVERVQ